MAFQQLLPMNIFGAVYRGEGGRRGGLFFRGKAGHKMAIKRVFTSSNCIPTAVVYWSNGLIRVEKHSSKCANAILIKRRKFRWCILPVKIVKRYTVPNSKRQASFRKVNEYLVDVSLPCDSFEPFKSSFVKQEDWGGWKIFWKGWIMDKREERKSENVFFSSRYTHCTNVT